MAEIQKQTAEKKLNPPVRFWVIIAGVAIVLFTLAFVIISYQASYTRLCAEHCIDKGFDIATIGSGGFKLACSCSHSLT